MDQMNQNNPQMNPGTEPPMSSGSPKPKEENLGGIIAIIVIVALLLIGGWYYFAQVEGVLNQEPSQEATLEEQAADDQAVADLGTQSTSDETAAIEADVNATDLSGMDNAAASIDSDFQAQ